MSLAAFVFEAVVISLTGVMAPGPITSVVVGQGNESPHAGALVAIGHGIVELPLMIGVYCGLGHLLVLPYAGATVALLGGLFLLWLGQDLLRRLQRRQVHASLSPHTPLVAGIALSAGNPYFLVWWATVGSALIVRSVRFGAWGFVALALAHWLCDLVWNSALSVLAFKGGQVLGGRLQRAITVVSGACLIAFGGRFVIQGVRTLLR